MARTDRLVALGAAFIVLYAAVLVVNGPENREEAFPVFSWSLFSKIPEAELTDYSIRLTSVNGQELPTPLYYDQATSLLVTARRPEPNLVMQQLGSAVARDKPYAAALAKETLEDRWLEGIDSAEYEIVRRRFDIIERSRCDCFEEETVLRAVTFQR
jgi:hypothetical protein